MILTCNTVNFWNHGLRFFHNRFLVFLAKFLLAITFLSLLQDRDAKSSIIPMKWVVSSHVWKIPPLSISKCSKRKSQIPARGPSEKIYRRQESANQVFFELNPENRCSCVPLTESMRTRNPKFRSHFSTERTLRETCKNILACDACERSESSFWICNFIWNSVRNCCKR